jgi:small-conductance mechanosensitive channel
MIDLPNDSDINITHIIVKPLYFGMVCNVIIPLAALFGIYFYNNKYGGTNHVANSEPFIFYLLIGITIIETLGVVWWRDRLFKTPMIKRAETFEADFAAEYLRRCKPIFLVIASLSLYGVVFYFLTGQFERSVIFVIISYVVFQIVRPRHGLVSKLLAHQRELVKKGEFLRS